MFNLYILSAALAWETSTFNWKIIDGNFLIISNRHNFSAVSIVFYSPDPILVVDGANEGLLPTSQMYTLLSDELETK